MPKTLKLIVPFVLVFLLCLFSQTAFASSVIINEIAWAGTTEGWRYEWIELFNSDEVIDISGWQIENGASGNKSLLLSAGAIPSEGYFLICRKEMANCNLVETKLSLHNEYNKNGQLVLRDSAGSLIDSTSSSGNKNWHGGDNTTKQTMERTNTGWQTSAEPNGTPRAINSTVAPPEAPVAPLSPPESPTQLELPQIPDEIPLLEPKSGSEQVPEPVIPEPQPITYPSDIFINEILPSPEGADAENEWIELYNANDFEVDLGNWQLQDAVGQTKTYAFPNRTIIAPLGFLLCPRTKTKITLQNSGDSIELLNPNQEIVYSTTYPKAPKGQSYNKINEAWAWSATLTPNSTNVVSQLEAGPRTASQPEPEAADADFGSLHALREETLADITEAAPQSMSQSSSRLLVIVIAVIIAIGSAIIALFLKNKTEQDV